MARTSRRQSNPDQRTAEPLDNQARQTASLSAETGAAADTGMPPAQFDNTEGSVDKGNPQARESAASDDGDGASQAETHASDHETLAMPGLVHRDLQGRIEVANRTEIKGWVWDPEAPNEQIRIELIDGEDQLALAVAGDERPELVQLGCGDGRHGFFIQLDEGLLSESQHILTLRCADTGAPVPGSPIVLQPSAGARQTALQWYLDEITDKEVRGWIASTTEPSRHRVIVLKEDGQILARAVASQFRADLLSANIGDGCYAFALQLPHSLLDGQEHLLEIADEETGLTLNEEPVVWRSAAGTAGAPVTGVAQVPGVEEKHPSVMLRADYDTSRPPEASSKRPAASGAPRFRAPAHVGTRVLFDISDLIYYIGEHPNLTGIQRVQSSIVLATFNSALLAPSSAIFLSFNAKARNWVAIPTGFLISLLRDLLLPEELRLVPVPAEEARYGVLPGAMEFDGIGTLDDGNPSVLCLLGAAWVHQDYLNRVLSLKRQFGTRFVMTVHDLIPIYARETCDQDTARVFEEFMQRALPHVDHVLAVSENTAKDVRRYLGALQIPVPPITVTKNGSSFAEFLPKNGLARQVTLRDLPDRFVLFVATIEGRKNHRLIFDVWCRMVDDGYDPPALVCVGRLGWKASTFISSLVETNYLGGRIHLLRDISDADLRTLYDRCLFTLCPSFYEGWGLPVGESLAIGKVCVSSNRASIPEVAGDCGVYIEIDNVDLSLEVIRNLIHDEKALRECEEKIRRDYVPITWRSVAERVVAACDTSINVKWQEPYPYSTLPYSTEISFGQLDHGIDGTGELLLTRVVDARLGHFSYRPLEKRNFLLGEEIRSSGSWAQPERWGTWLCHAGGDIVFTLAAEASHFYFVFLRLRVCGWLHETPITLLANGERLWEGEIGPDSKDVMLRVRKRATAAKSWRLRIETGVTLSSELKNQIGAVDGRIPTVGFERLMIVPENDVKTRLDVISKLHYQ